MEVVVSIIVGLSVALVFYFIGKRDGAESERRQRDHVARRTRTVEQKVDDRADGIEERLNEMSAERRREHAVLLPLLESFVAPPDEPEDQRKVRKAILDLEALEPTIPPSGVQPSGIPSGEAFGTPTLFQSDPPPEES